MKLSLSLKINTVIVTIFLLFCTILPTADYLERSRELQHELEHEATMITTRLQLALEYPLWDINLTAIGSIVQAEMQDRNIRAIFVWDGYRNTLLSGSIKDDREQIGPALSPPASSDDLITASADIVHNEGSIGKVTVYLTDRYLRQQLFTELKLMAIRLGLLGLLVTTLLILLIRSIILLRIDTLKAEFKDVEDGNLDQQITLAHHDELTELSRSFDSLRLKIKHQIHTLSHEVEERRQAQNALAESEKKFRRLVEDIHEDFFFYSCDLLGNLQYLSPSVHTMLGCDDEGFQRDCLPYLMRSTADDKPITYETTVTNQGGQPVTLHVHEVPIHDNAGKVVAVEGLAHNITHSKALEAQLRQAQKVEAIGTLAGGIAHDFNNMLAAMLGYTELAIANLDPSSGVVGHLKESLKAMHRARDLVQQILAFSRKSVQERRPLAISQIAAEAMKLLRPSIPTTIEIRQEIGNSSGMVLADPTQIHQVIMNLCTNGAQAMEDDGGMLRIAVTDVTITPDDLTHTEELPPAGSYVRLEVEDNGPGIPQEHIDKIFDPYFTTKDVGKGSGMGLAVVAGIVKSHEGTMVVDNSPGKGVRFSVYFPVADHLLQAQPTNDEQPLPTGTEHILIVDDEESVAEITALRLKQLGYTVTTSTSSSEALTLFGGDPHRFDLVITDQTMPQLTGDKLIAELRRLRPDVPVILCTGYSSRIEKEPGSTIFGANALLSKPVAGRDLAETVRAVLTPDHRHSHSAAGS